MIRASTGRPSVGRRHNTGDDDDDDTGRRRAISKLRPSSASAKLQSRSYVGLSSDENRPFTGRTGSKPGVYIKTGSTQQAGTKHQGVKSAKPPLERRLTLSTVDGIGVHAKTLTRLNTPSTLAGKIKIEERITLEQLYRIKTAFEEADTDGSGTLDIDEFKQVIKNSLGVKGKSEDQINALFMKIDSSSDGEIDWDEFCTYMQLEYSEKEEAILRSKLVSFVLPAVTVSLPAISAASPHHNATIFRVIGIGESYMCATQDGLFTFWSKNLKLRRMKSIVDSATVERQAFVSRPTMWVTDAVAIPGQGKLLVGSGERKLHFYDIISFEFLCQIIGFDAVPLQLHITLTDEGSTIAVFGDDQGCVSIFTFANIGETLRKWKKSGNKVFGVPTITIQDAANSKDVTFTKWKVHNDWITEIRYFHEIRSVISSSNDYATSLVRGCTTPSTALDQLKNQLNPSSILPSIGGKSATSGGRRQQMIFAQRRQKSDQSVFRVHKGVKTFDFTKEYNVLATGGMDRIVRLWNPYVPQKPTGLLRGHNSPILFINISTRDKRIYSISADKCVKVWDLLEQNCLMTVNSKLHKIRGEIVTCTYVDSTRALAIATDQLSILKLSRKSGDLLPLTLSLKQAKLAGETATSHGEPVTCCKYNPNFGHVITTSQASAVKLWDFETGTFMFEFNEAHGTHSITSATFDWSGRRLVTSGRDGKVKIWNYNNGACLRSLEREHDDSEVADCTYFESNNKQYIIAVGWDQRINIFDDESDDYHLVQRPHQHWPDDLKRGHTEDIVSVTFGYPTHLATVSYEGLIIVWNLVSGFSISRIPYPAVHNQYYTGYETDEEYLGSDGEAIEHEARHAQEAVNKVIFLHERIPDKESASLLAGCSDGSCILWNFYSGLAHAHWSATRRKSALSYCCVSTDLNTLYVGDELGYVTIWNIKNYALRPLLLLPLKEVCPTRTKAPPRVESFRSHVQRITCLSLVEEHDIIITSSVDCAVRVWTNQGKFIGTFGQSTPWDIYTPSTWQHPMVPPEVLLDPRSMPEHPVLDEKSSLMEVVHQESLEASDSDEEDENIDDVLGEPMTIREPKARRSSSLQPWIGGTGGSSEIWKRRLSRRLSRLSNLSAFNEDDSTMLDQVRQSMRSGSGKRLRHEKQPQLRSLKTSDDVSAQAYQSLPIFKLSGIPGNVSKPNVRKHIDDVFQIQEEDEEGQD